MSYAQKIIEAYDAGADVKDLLSKIAARITKELDRLTVRRFFAFIQPHICLGAYLRGWHRHRCYLAFGRYSRAD